MGKEEIARNEQFLLFPQCFLLNQKIVSPFLNIFEIISWFATELEEPKIGISGKGLKWFKLIWKSSFSHRVFKKLALQICKIKGLFGNGLALYHTILTFNDPVMEGFRKHYGERRKCWLPAFSPFPKMFSTVPKPNFIFHSHLFCRLQMLSI